VPETENRDLTCYHTMWLRWVHRSAYDCIMNSPSGELAASLRPDDDQDLARKTLAAVVWLSKHVPHIRLRSGQLRTTFNLTTTYIIRLSDIPGTDLGRETEQALDELFEALMSSLYVEDGASLCPPLSELLDPSSKRRQTMLPLWDFWKDVVLSEDIDKFLLPQFGLLTQSACTGFALKLLGEILHIISMRSWDHLPVAFHMAIDTLAAIGHSGRRSRAVFGLGSSGFFTYILGGKIWDIMSFSGNDIGEEHVRMMEKIAIAIRAASTKVRDGRHDLWHDCTTRLYEVCEAWDIYHGYVTTCGPGLWSPLQLQVPLIHFNQQRYALPASLKIRWPQRTLRLLCLVPEQIATDSIPRRGPFIVTACFDISGQCSQAINDLLVYGTSKFGDFVEPMGQDRCKQLILNDIWDDPDGQLDAWQRLYVRAYVRKWFKYLRFPRAAR